MPRRVKGRIAMCWVIAARKSVGVKISKFLFIFGFKRERYLTVSFGARSVIFSTEKGLRRMYRVS